MYTAETTMLTRSNMNRCRTTAGFSSGNFDPNHRIAGVTAPHKSQTIIFALNSTHQVYGCCPKYKYHHWTAEIVPSAIQNRQISVHRDLAEGISVRSSRIVSGGVRIQPYDSTHKPFLQEIVSGRFRSDTIYSSGVAIGRSIAVCRQCETDIQVVYERR